MYYSEISGVRVSALGMGNMRLPKIENQGEKIDREKAQEIIDYAMSHGITYYDTAYRYHGGESERFIGEALKKYPRDSGKPGVYFSGKLQHPIRGHRHTHGRVVESIYPAQRSRNILGSAIGNAWRA